MLRVHVWEIVKVGLIPVKNRKFFVIGLVIEPVAHLKLAFLDRHKLLRLVEVGLRVASLLWQLLAPVAGIDVVRRLIAPLMLQSS